MYFCVSLASTCLARLGLRPGVDTSSLRDIPRDRRLARGLTNLQLTAASRSRDDRLHYRARLTSEFGRLQQQIDRELVGCQEAINAPLAR
jgi:hypothetical protein